MPDWIDRFAWNTPKTRFILGMREDGSTVEVQWNPLKQAWEDFDGKAVNDWAVWREIEDE